MSKKKLNKQGLRELTLRPYPGVVFVTKDRKAFVRAARDLFGRDEDLRGKAGRFLQEPCWYHPHTALVWWSNPETLAHELAHVCFGVFDMIGADPREGREEPFCYLLSQLYLEATQK